MKKATQRVLDNLTKMVVSNLESGIFVYGIDWDCDGQSAESLELPTQIFIGIENDELNISLSSDSIFAIQDKVGEYLSNIYGYCHNGFFMRIVY